jgi:DNA-binding Lrp family transcriptional regulator
MREKKNVSLAYYKTGMGMVEVVRAYVVATVKRGSEHRAAEKIRRMAEVTEVLVTYGLYDLVIRIEAKSLGHLDKVVTDIRQMEEIEQTSTLVGA